MKKVFIIYLALLPAVLTAQDNNILFELDTVHLKKIFLQDKLQKHISNQVLTLSDAPKSLTGLLQEKHLFFIREYGSGMISSVSLRGTGSAHTQIVWNGIPVNSVLNGQTDLNTIFTDHYEQVRLIKGGSGVAYGSGAIGGVINLENKLSFEKKFAIENKLSVGSFKSVYNSIQLTQSNQNYYTKFGFQIRKSKNDYPYVGYDIYNENGAYEGLEFNSVVGYKINPQHQIYFKTSHNDLDREMSRTLFKPDQAKLLTSNHKNMIGWKYQIRNFSSKTDMAYLFERYRYFFNKNLPVNSHSLSNVYFAKNISGYKFSSQRSIEIGQELQLQTASGDHISYHKRSLYGIYAVWNQGFKNITYKLQLRKNISNDFKIPFIGAVNFAYQFNPKHIVKVIVSKNYRIPTFNDLYWTPGGNCNLKPEQSYTAEIRYAYQNKNSKIINFFRINPFYIRSNNLIKWTPDPSGLWSPKNIEKVDYQGFEMFVENTNLINTKQFTINFSAGYTFQQAINQANKKQVPYVPQHKGTGKIILNYATKFSFFYTYIYQGKIYTTTTQTHFLPAYQIHNLSLRYKINNHISISGIINNLLNSYYESVPSRPQPGRNYQLNINFKI